MYALHFYDINEFMLFWEYSINLTVRVFFKQLLSAISKYSCFPQIIVVLSKFLVDGPCFYLAFPWNVIVFSA